MSDDMKSKLKTVSVTKAERKYLADYAVKNNLDRSEVLEDFMEYKKEHFGAIKLPATNYKRPEKIEQKSTRKYISPSYTGLTQHETLLFNGMFKRASVRDRLEVQQLPKSIGFKFLKESVTKSWIKHKKASPIKAPIHKDFKNYLTQGQANRIAKKYNPYVGLEDYRGYNPYEQKLSEYKAYLTKKNKGK